MTTPTPGWYPDPEGHRHRARWWDGRAWTDRTGPARARRRPGRVVLGGALAAVAVVVVLILLHPPGARPPEGTAAPVPTSARDIAPAGGFDEATREVTLAGLAMTMPGQPYQTDPTARAMPGVFDVAFWASAPVHPRFDGQRDWVATVGLGALEPTTTADGQALAERLMSRLTQRLFPVAHPRTGQAMIQRDRWHGRERVRVTQVVSYAVPELPSTADQVSLVLVDTDLGWIAAVAVVPDDADTATQHAASTALSSLRIT